IKGLELPSHDPRAFYSQALGYATSPRGACHLQSYSHGLEAWMTMPELGFPEIAERLSTERKGEMVAKMQNLMSLFDSLKTCKFVLYAGVEIKNLVEWLNAITGWGFDRRDFLLAGERIFNLKTAFNRREGFRVKNDTLPLRFLKDISESKFERMKRDYYTFRGWNEEGIPLPETIERLGLTSVDFFTTFAGARRR
ncbi:MAG: aldehyde ferredoxin oxidoreductase, partial [Spirochaetes bacterium]